MTINDNYKKPAIVAFALLLMYAVVAVGFLRTGMTIGRHIDVRTPYLYLGSKTLLYVLSVFLIYQIGERHNWARWTLIAILIVAIPLGVLPTFDSLEHSPLHAQLGFAQLAAFVLAAICLFLPQASAWIKPNSQPG
jgi:hypothetical protein